MKYVRIKTQWRAWTDATAEQKAAKVFQRLYQQLGVEVESAGIETHHKGGYQTAFSVVLSGPSWAVCVFDLICLGQRVGNSWCPTGSVQDDPHGMTNQSSVAGITSIAWQCHVGDVE